MYREGFLLERVRVAAQYGTAWAAVECPALTPNETWSGAVRNAPYAKAIAAVRSVERQLAVKVLERWPTFAKMHPSARHYLLSSSCRKRFAAPTSPRSTRSRGRW